ncbi:hypothetical protein HAX54_017717 [Datura stramonium]|uniref:Uncharacterized protein n=1 Tax=Datura stramonium TaxID=4076 RepID=A0ABS8S135_DATST|nr:hypothetical protein [Datura stramonium]
MRRRSKLELPTDFPPESFWLSKDAEFDWFDRNAFLDRKQSTKGIGPNTTNLNPAKRSESTLKAASVTEPSSPKGVTKKPARSSTDKVLGSRVEEPVKPMRKSKSVSIGKTRGAPVGVEPVFSEPVGLGGMKRFSSGRRSESWGGDEINAVV